MRAFLFANLFKQCFFFFFINNPGNHFWCQVHEGYSILDGSRSYSPDWALLVRTLTIYSIDIFYLQCAALFLIFFDMIKKLDVSSGQISLGIVVVIDCL